MALKITAQIGTDQGITSEAYVRIMSYQINKIGNAYFNIQLFKSEEDATEVSASGPVAIAGQVARNAQIGDSLVVPMTKVVTVTQTVKRSVPEEQEVTETITVPPAEEGGEPTTQTVSRTQTVFVEKDVEESIEKTVPDLSAAEGIDIFEFGYSKLKEKLVGLFGEENVVDC